MMRVDKAMANKAIVGEELDLEAGVGIEPTHKSFAGSCITTLLPSQIIC